MYGYIVRQSSIYSLPTASGHAPLGPTIQPGRCLAPMTGHFRLQWYEGTKACMRHLVLVRDAAPVRRGVLGKIAFRTPPVLRPRSAHRIDRAAGMVSLALAQAGIADRVQPQAALWRGRGACTVESRRPALTDAQRTEA